TRPRSRRRPTWPPWPRPHPRCWIDRYGTARRGSGSGSRTGCWRTVRRRSPNCEAAVMRVLIPRSRAGDPLVAALSHAGHRVLAADLITTAPAAAEILDGVLERLTGAEWLAITSATTVEVLAGRARAVGASLGELTRSVAVAAVG